MGRKTITDKKYLESGVWKCSNAPINKDIPLQVLLNIGAHYWKEIQSTADGRLHTGLWYCKYCFDARRFPADWDEANPSRIIQED